MFSSSNTSILSQYAVLRIESPLWKCLFALLRIPEMSLPAGLHPVRWTDESTGGEEDHERRLWYLMISQCVPRARTNLFYVWCVAQYRNGHTNPFISLRAMAKFSKMLEHFQKWPLSKASFGARDCKNPSISVPSEAIWHCDLSSFKIASVVVKISNFLKNRFDRTVQIVNEYYVMRN